MQKFLLILWLIFALNAPVFAVEQPKETSSTVYVQRNYKPRKKCYPYDKFYLLKKWLPLYAVLFTILIIYLHEKKDRKHKEKIDSLTRQLADLETSLNQDERNLQERLKVGQIYEKYVGRYLQRKGYTVEYKGIKRGFDDEGIDLICCKDEEMLLIQCKNWAKDKVLHENYIFQLYGAWKFYEVTEKKKAAAALYCTCKVTNQARIIARILDIQIVEEFKMLN